MKLGLATRLRPDGQVPRATLLAFPSDPGNTDMGATISSFTVEARKTSGTVDSSFVRPVTIALASNPGSGTLSGTLTKTAVAGVATFDDLSIDNYADSYTLTASANRVTAATCGAFDINAIVVQDGLQAWWKHNEGSGTDLNDYINGFDGAIRGANFWDNNGPDGNPVGTYDGATNGIEEIGTGLELTGSLSLTMAIYVDNQTFGRCVIPKRKGGGGTQRANYQIILASVPSEIAFSFTEGDTNGWAVYETTNFSSSTGIWYIVTFVYTQGVGSSAKWYTGATLLEGAWTTSDGNTAHSSPSTRYVVLGGMDTSDPGDGIVDTNFWQGRMGDILIYNKILSLAEITRNYNALRGRYDL